MSIESRYIIYDDNNNICPIVIVKVIFAIEMCFDPIGLNLWNLLKVCVNMLNESPYVTSYMIQIVIFTLLAIIYKIFAIRVARPFVLSVTVRI